MNTLVEKKQSIDALIETLFQNKQNIQDWLITYVNMKKHTEMLDSFYFQSKLIDAEYELVQKIYKMIENRMYGEYYKLWLVMHQYTKEIVKEERIKFPPYKDLEPTKQYDSKTTQSMYDEIGNLFKRLKQVTDKNQKDIEVHREQLHKGIHIENYINTLSYQLGLMEDQVSLFQNMFESYQRYHHQRYDHFIQKIELLNKQIEGKLFPTCSQCEELAEFCRECSTGVRTTEYSCEKCGVRQPVYCMECVPKEPAVPLDPAPVDPLLDPVPLPLDPVLDPVPLPLDPVVESPVDPVPMDPLPVDPSPVEEPLPVDPSPVEEPLPVDPSPVEEPLPVDPSPVEVPLPVDPSPVDHVDPAPVEDTLPVDTAPVDPVVDTVVEPPMDQVGESPADPLLDNVVDPTSVQELQETPIQEVQETPIQEVQETPVSQEVAQDTLVQESQN